MKKKKKKSERKKTLKYTEKTNSFFFIEVLFAILSQKNCSELFKHPELFKWFNVRDLKRMIPKMVSIFSRSLRGSSLSLKQVNPQLVAHKRSLTDSPTSPKLYLVLLIKKIVRG